MVRVLKAFVLVVLAGGFVGLFLLWWGLNWLDSPGPLESNRVFVVDRGETSTHLAQRLEAQGVIDHAMVWPFFQWVTHGEGEIKAGEYAIPAHIAPSALLALFRSGKVIIHRITVPEGLSAPEIVALLNRQSDLAGTITKIPPEGSLMPDTYFYTIGDEREDILDRMHRAMARFLAETLRGATAESPDLSQAEIVILASIVEKETALPEERPKIAGLFLNRLKRGMKLQSDPTVIYGITHGQQKLDHALTRTEIDQPTEFNTYTNKGLPPAPIANPGRDAIRAVVHPEKSDFLYFVADGSGGHAFAATLAAHNHNVARWRQNLATQSTDSVKSPDPGR